MNSLYPPPGALDVLATAERELAEEKFREAVEQRKAALRTRDHRSLKQRVVDTLIHYLERTRDV